MGKTIDSSIPSTLMIKIVFLENMGMVMSFLRVILALCGLLTMAEGRESEGAQTHIGSPLSFCNDEIERNIGRLFKMELGYTLIGKKPVSIEEGRAFLEHDFSQQEEKIREFLIEAFKNSQSFILQLPADPKKCLPLTLIHKSALTKVINENEELNDFVTKKFVTIDKLFNHLQNSHEGIPKTFENNDFLLGLILGYGRSNPEYYCRRNELEAYLKTLFFFEMIPQNPNPRTCCLSPVVFYFLDDYERCKRVPVPKEKFGSLEAEWKWIKKIEWKLGCCRNPLPPYKMDYPLLPFYICRHGGDSEQVRKKYIKARDHLANLFYHRSPTDVVMKEALK